MLFLLKITSDFDDLREEKLRLSSLMSSQTALLADKTAELEHVERLLADADKNLNAIRIENESILIRLTQAESHTNRTKNDTNLVKSQPVGGWDSFEPIVISDDQTSLDSTELGQIMTRLSETEAQLREINVAKEQLHEQNVDLRAQVESIATINRLVTKRDELDAEMSRLLDEVKSRETAIEETQTIYQALNENLVEWQRSNTAVEEEIAVLQARNEEFVGKIETQTNDERVRKLEEEKRDVDRRLADARGEIILLTAENRALSERRDELTSRVNEMKELSQDFDALRADYLNVSTLNGKLSDDLRIANGKNDHLVDHYEHKIHELLADIERKDAEIQGLNVKISEYDNGKKFNFYYF